MVFILSVLIVASTSFPIEERVWKKAEPEIFKSSHKFIYKISEFFTFKIFGLTILFTSSTSDTADIITVPGDNTFLVPLII